MERGLARDVLGWGHDDVAAAGAGGLTPGGDATVRRGRLVVVTIDGGSALEQETARLRLRRPRPDDLPAYVALHTDPRTYAHAPHSRPDEAGCRERLEADLAHWAEHGFGYVAVLDRTSGAVVGWGGVRSWPGDDPRELNLYYRLAHDRLGQGLGRELSRAVVEAAVEDLPEHRVVARMVPHNAASLATARSAGLALVGEQAHPDDRPGDPPSLVWAGPRLVAVTDPAEVPREEVLDHWLRVNRAGGAVGFLPEAPRDAVAAALEAHLAVLASLRGVLGLLRRGDGTLAGLGFWHRETTRGYTHRLTLWRVMTDPDRRRQGTGRQLVRGLHGLARRWSPRSRLWLLDYRSGLGLGSFYAGLGWREIGRVPAGILLLHGETRDDVLMARVPDGGPLGGDGLT